jgi:hypothetical protein
MASIAYTKSALRVSTMVITAHWGTSLQMDTLSESLRSILIPIWYPDVGILKFEHKNMVLGCSYKDIFTNRKITTKSHYFVVTFHSLHACSANSTRAHIYQIGD